MDQHALFPEREDDRDEQAIAAACARLDRPACWTAADGHEHAIVGAAVDGGRVAWVEKRAHTTAGGWEDVDYFLYLCAGDELLREWTVETYNPYFGCEVGHLRWWGDEVVMIYGEKHRTIACALGPSGPPRMRVLSYSWQVLGAVALYASEARGLVERASLPGFERRAPLPCAVAAERMSAGTYDTGPPIAGLAALLPEIAAGLPAAARPFAELLAGALAYRFWDAWPPVVDGYQQAYEQGRWNTPCWLPFYQYCASDPDERRTLLAALDAAAGRPPTDSADAAELACRHIADRCRELAAACRAERLPVTDYFWVEWSQAEFADALALFPAGMWAAWQALRPRAREFDALGHGRT
jgi:hypothetical protein